MADALLLDRRRMTDPDAIVERMARDILDARHSGQYGLVDLTRSGWSMAQVMRWGATGGDLATSPAFLAQVEVERLRWLKPVRCQANAEMAEIVEATRSPDAPPGALERTMTALSGNGPTAAIFGLVWFGSLALCLMRPLG